ncbi:MAG: hypothetical protein GZ087_14580 [Flavobacterium sp.]|nr:hypothetical protein [Flavobacterium sp.]
MRINDFGIAAPVRNGSDQILHRFINWCSPDGSDILFPASLAGKRYSVQQEIAPEKFDWQI